jgi:hypothetical protein
MRRHGPVVTLLHGDVVLRESTSRDSRIRPAGGSSVERQIRRVAHAGCRRLGVVWRLSRGRRRPPSGTTLTVI